MLAKDKVIGFEEPENKLQPDSAKVHEDLELDKWATFGFDDGISRNEVICGILVILSAIALIKWGY